MPEGIGVELIIFVVLLAVVGGVFFLGRRKPGEPPTPTATKTEAPSETAGAVDLEDPPLIETAQPPVVVEDQPVAVESDAPVAERPSLRDRLSRSRRFLADRLSDVFGRAPDDETWDDVEAALIQADVGVETATKITEDLRAKAKYLKVVDADEVRGLLAEELVELFDDERDRTLQFAGVKPTVWLIVGVNGTGKTTTIGKLARDLKERGHTVALAAADTFRAAADEQLGVWGERAGAEIVKHQPGADPGAVAFDAYKFASARGLDVLLVDTAGRLHTKTPLMEELTKIRRVIEKEGQVQECLLVIDATAGQNGLVQAREFAEASGVTGVVLTKLDGTAKGGIALAIEDTLGIPIKLIGVGEGIDDIEPFDPKTFVDALLS
jgi:fused signal recognition particle receptor